MPTSSNMVPNIDNLQGLEGYQGNAHTTSHKKSQVVTHQRLGSYPEAVIDTLLVHKWGQDHSRKDTAVPDAQGKMFFKYKEGYIWKGMAIIPAISLTTSAFGCDHLCLFWILATVAILAGGDGNAKGTALGAAGQADLPGVADWRMCCGILFQRFKNWYLVASYEAVTHRILEHYVGLRWLPAFRRALKLTRPHWAPQYLPELLPGDLGLESEVQSILAACGPAGHALHGRAHPPPQPPTSTGAPSAARGGVGGGLGGGSLHRSVSGPSGSGPLYTGAGA